MHGPEPVAHQALERDLDQLQPAEVEVGVVLDELPGMNRIVPRIGWERGHVDLATIIRGRAASPHLTS